MSDFYEIPVQESLAGHMIQTQLQVTEREVAQNRAWVSKCSELTSSNQTKESHKISPVVPFWTMKQFKKAGLPAEESGQTSDHWQQDKDYVN